MSRHETPRPSLRPSSVSPAWLTGVATSQTPRIRRFLNARLPESSGLIQRTDTRIDEVTGKRCRCVDCRVRADVRTGSSEHSRLDRSRLQQHVDPVHDDFFFRRAQPLLRNRLFQRENGCQSVSKNCCEIHKIVGVTDALIRPVLLRQLAAKIAANRFYGLPDGYEGGVGDEMLDPPRSQVIRIALEMLVEGELQVEDY